jgi:hypothetical protein
MMLTGEGGCGGERPTRSWKWTLDTPYPEDSFKRVMAVFRSNRLLVNEFAECPFQARISP